MSANNLLIRARKAAKHRKEWPGGANLWIKPVTNSLALLQYNPTESTSPPPPRVPKSAASSSPGLRLLTTLRKRAATARRPCPRLVMMRKNTSRTGTSTGPGRQPGRQPGRARGQQQGRQGMNRGPRNPE